MCFIVGAEILKSMTNVSKHYRSPRSDTVGIFIDRGSGHCSQGHHCLQVKPLRFYQTKGSLALTSPGAW
jgi:hypothetical protein